MPGEFGFAILIQFLGDVVGDFRAKAGIQPETQGGKPGREHTHIAVFIDQGEHFIVELLIREQVIFFALVGVHGHLLDGFVQGGELIAQIR